jgi:hypothetical protein
MTSSVRPKPVVVEPDMSRNHCFPCKAALLAAGDRGVGVRVKAEAPGLSGRMPTDLADPGAVVARNGSGPRY